MRILLVHNYYQYWGGEDSYFESLVKLLRDKGHIVITYTKDSKKIKTISNKIKTGIGMFWNMDTEKELTYIIKKNKPDIAHFHNLYPIISPTAYWICKRYKITIIQHIHNYRFMCPKGTLFRKGTICELCVARKLPFYSVIFRCYHQSRLASLFFSFSFFFHKLINTFRLIDRFIFPSEFTRSYYIKNLAIPISKTSMIPNLIEEFDKTIQNNKQLSQKKYFLYIGRLSEEKGIIELLNLFKELPTKKIVVIGDGPLKNHVDLYKKYENIEIKGFLSRNKTLTYVKNANCIIIPSLWYEVLPSVYLEAYIYKILVLLPKNDNLFKITKKNPRAIFYKINDNRDLKIKIENINKISLDIERKNNQKLVAYSSQTHYKKLNRTYKSQT